MTPYGYNKSVRASYSYGFEVDNFWFRVSVFHEKYKTNVISIVERGLLEKIERQFRILVIQYVFAPISAAPGRL